MVEVDNKVVSIQFDNAAFQQKMSQTIASLDKLRASLDMAGAKQGLTQLSAAAKQVDMTPMAVSVEGISAKFAALATVGITVLSQLVSTAMGAAGQIAKAFTINPVTAGFSEFELKMGSIQTIMAGSGASLEEVNSQLNVLNAYADRTIFSFADMTQNIGKFTNAGVSLDQSVGAIQGVANVAALAGANAEEASRGMYNFAQALSTGSVKLIDWKSIELANMGTVEFKQQLIDAAVAMGTLNKASDGTLTTLEGTQVTTKNFASTLQDAWLTSEVLTTTLNKFSDTTTDIGKRAAAAATDVKTFSQMIGTMKESLQSGWAMSFEHILGNFAEGKSLWTNIMGGFNSIVGASAEARNTMLEQWKAFGGGGGGRTALMGGLEEAVKGIGTILKPIKEAFREIFPKKTVEDLLRATAAFVRFSKTIKITEETAEKVKAAFKGFFAIISIGLEIVKGVTRVFFAIIKVLWQVFSPLLNLVSGAGSLVSAFHGVAVEGKGIETFFTGIVTAIESFGEAVSGVISGLVKFVDELGIFQAISAGLGNAVNMLSRAANAVKEFFSSLSFGKEGSEDTKKAGEDLEDTASIAERLLATLRGVFTAIGDVLSKIAGAISGAFKGLGGAIADAMSSGNIDNVFNVLKVGLLGGILVFIRKFFKEGLKLDFGQKGIFDKIKDMLGTVESSLKSLQANIRADTLLKIASAMGILALSIIALSLVDGDALAKSMAAISVGFAQLTAVMLTLEKVSAGGGAIRIIAMAAGMVLLAVAMGLLVIPIKILSTMGWEEIAKGLVGVGAGMLIMAKAMSTVGSASGTVGLIKAGLSMILIATAMTILARAIKKFAEIGLADMALGLGSAAIGIQLLIKALDRMPADIQKDGIGLLILALALGALARVVKTFAGMPIFTIAKGFLAVAAGLALIGEAMKRFPKDMQSKTLMLLGLSVAMIIMAKAVEQIGSIPFGKMVKGLAGLAVMLGVLAAAILVMDQAEGGVAGLLAASIGLLVIGKAVEQVGSIPFGQLIKGIIGIAAVLAVLAIAANVAPGILLLGVALTAVGIAILFVGAGIALLGKGFELMAKFGAAGMKHIAGALQEFIKQMPQFVSALVAGLVQAVIEIADQMPKLIDSVVKILTALLDAIIEVAPKVGEAVRVLIDELLTTFDEAIPRLIESGMLVITSFLQGVRDNIGKVATLALEIVEELLNALAAEMPNFVQSVVNFISTAVQEIAFGLGQLMPTLMIGVGASFLEGFWTGLTQQIPRLGEIIGKIVNDIIQWFKDRLGIKSPSRVMIEIGKFVIQGLINGIKAMFNALRLLIVEIPRKILGWIGSATFWLVDKGKNIISGLLNGIREKIGDVRTWFFDLGGKIIGWISGALSWLFESGKDVIRGLWNGINSMKDWLKDKVEGAVSWVTGPFQSVLEMFSPSRLFASYGVNIAKGLVIGIDSMKGRVTNSSKQMADNVKNAWSDSATWLKISEPNLGSFDLNPVITPVLDLSKVEKEAKKLASVIKSRDLIASLSFDEASVIVDQTNRPNVEQPIIHPEPSNFTFTQINNSPKALSVSDIHRRTRTQIAFAKEELKIP